MTPRHILALLLLALPHVAARADLLLHRVTSGLDWPVMVTHAGVSEDDRLFVLEQGGWIRIVESDSLVTAPFLDLSARMESMQFFTETGLLGLAFHPDYASNGYFFVHYCDAAGVTTISRFSVTADPYVADPGSEVVLLTLQQPDPIHNGGSIAFSPVDGFLYVVVGDGGPAGDPANRAQNPSSLFGKVLRLDVDGGVPYAVPPSNPFVGVPGYREEIWALGVRNPYRWSFDRATGDLWLADVGQTAWEEIDVQPAASPGGENYGWRLKEGTHCFIPAAGCDPGGLVDPVYEYPHDPECAIVGGYVYRGGALPLVGKYFFADYCTKKIASIVVDGQNVTEVIDWTSSLPTDVGMISFIVGFGEDVDGELYVVDRGVGIDTGDVYALIDDGTVAVNEIPSPPAVTLSEPAPNPFRTGTSLRISTRTRGTASAKVLDAAGRLVCALSVDADGPGRHRVSWDGRDERGRVAPAGVYFLRVRVGSESATRSVRLVR